MSGVNKAIIIGNLGNDPEVRYLPNGDAVANFTVATSETWKDKQSGEKKEATEWHRCVAFRKQAEIIEQYLKKGSKVFVEGKLQTRSWEQDGVKKYSTEIVVKEFQFLDSRSETGNSREQAPAKSQQQHKPAQQQPQSFDNFDDDVPF